MADRKVIGIILRVLLISSIVLEAAESRFLTYDALKRGDPTNVPENERCPPTEESSIHISSRKLAGAEMKSDELLALDKHIRERFA
ncbi:hypothetical protein ACP275_13G136100 [Erythranthe tilingii]